MSSAIPDAFDTLGLEPTLDLDASLLEQRYRDLQRQLHPDKFAQASSSEKRVSLSRAVSVNDAYRALRDDLKRAEVLFVRHGGSANEREQGPVDPELLMEVMELRESLAEAKSARDLSATQALSQQVAGLERAGFAELRAAFAKLAAHDKSALAEAGRALSRLRYYRRFQDEVAHIEEQALA